MTRDHARLKRLRRLERLRDVARIEALGRAAAAQQQLARHVALARRSDELASAFAMRWDAADGAALRDLRGFHANLASLSHHAARDSLLARQSADIEQLAAATAERKRDLVSDQISAAKRVMEKARTSRQLTNAAHLARSLNNPK